MGSLGVMAFASDAQQPFLGYELSQGKDYSEQTAFKIDNDIQTLLEDRHQAVKELLKDKQDKLDVLVDILLKDETIDQKALEKILGSRSFVHQLVEI
jgi:cell division protease FtsH